MATHLKTKKRQRFLKRVVANAIANQRFEGLEPSPAAIQDLKLVAAGTLSVHEALANLKSRSANVQILGR